MKTADRIRLAIIEVWADGQMPNTHTIAAATRNLGADEPVAANTVSQMTKRWALDGEAELQANSLRQGSTPWIFRWGPDDATARDVLEVAADRLSESQRRRLSTAMRHYLELPARTSPWERILSAAEAVSTSELFGLPDRVAKSAEDAGLSESTIRPWRSVVKAALKAAAEAGAVPVYFPRHHPEDEWEEACQRWYFHAGSDDGTSPTTRQTYASTVLRLRTALQDLELDRCPSSLTESDLEDHIYPHARSKMGSPAWVPALRTALRYVGRIHGEGPYAELRGTARNATSDGYLSVPWGKAGDLGAILDAMEDVGFQEDVLEFLRWYEDYSLLPDADLWGELALDGPTRFPTRPAQRHLTTRTWGHRLLALRAYCFHAVQVCERHDLPLDLKNVFGRAGVQILQEIEIWWQGRAARGEVASPHTTGIEGALLHAGMIARALYDRTLHLEGIEVTDEAGESPRGDRLDTMTMQADPTTRRYLAVYRHAQARASNFKAARRKSSSGHRKTDRKCIRTIYEQTPPSYWAAVGRAMQQQISEWDGKKGYIYYLLVRNAFVHGFVLSTGCRGSGLAWLKTSPGRGYGPENQETRRIDWEAWQRKNNRANSSFLRDTFLPLWLERLYLEEARPFFIERGIERGDLAGDHDALIVKSSTGDSLSDGWWPSNTDDYMQTGERAKKGVAQLAVSWRSSGAKAAASIGLGWSDRYGEGGPHAMRNSMASGIYRAKGVQEAADYLGDSVDTVEDTYAAVDGCHVDPTELELELVEDIATTVDEPSDVEPRLAELEEENQRLREMLARAKA